MRGEVRLIKDESKGTSWRVIKNKIVSKINLKRREITTESNMRAIFVAYADIRESTNHLFFECKVVWLI